MNKNPISLIGILFQLASLSLLVFMTFVSDTKSTKSKHFVLKPPLPPQKLEALTNNYKVILIWNEPVFKGSSGISEYIIYRKYLYSGYSEIGRSNSLTVFIDSNIIRSVDYYCYKVSAKNRFGESKLSNEVIAFPSIDSVQIVEEGSYGDISQGLTFKEF